MATTNDLRSRNVTAVLGPTNTGKTHLAIERMLGHETGLIGLPLRLLAREVYDKIASRVGVDKVALITGEEKIKPDNPRYWVCTVEAMPREIVTDFAAIDEVQLAADPERGHVFTDRLLHARGRQETLLLGAGTMREAIADLIPGANFISRPRLSKLTYSGQKKITRLPGRTAIVAFSASEVYAIAELIRRQQGGAAVVLGGLSPRTRNAQVALYQSGDVDYIVATDAIGMGLNLNVEHVALAGIRKFDGQNHRMLTPAELGQIAGRAGRHMNDGTFGVTGDVEPFDNDLVERLEGHTFDMLKTLQWRSRVLDFSSLDGLRESLRQVPRESRLARARMADDVLALESVSADREVAELAVGAAAISTLWDVCQVPDYRKISTQNHAELVATLYKSVMTGTGKVDEEWFAKQVAYSDRTDGDIDTISNRIAHIRTWTFVSNRPAWLHDPAHWQQRTRAIEDSLSDAMHELLTARFIDAKTSALMKGMREKNELEATIADDGSIKVENHSIGRLRGFQFTPDPQGEGVHGRASRHATAQVLSKELAMRARRVIAAKPEAFKLANNCRILWRDEEIARLEAGDDPLKPQVILLADEHLQGPDREKLQERLNTWMTETIASRLKPLVDISKATDVSGLARGIAYRLTENFGVLKRESVADEMKSLDQTARAQLRKYGIRFGAFNIYFPLLLKPAAGELRLVLWLLKSAAAHDLAIDALPKPPRPGLTSVLVDKALPEPFYRACGYHLCGPRAVRMDILERLSDLIRPLLAWKAPADNPSAAPPKGATGDGAFILTPEMMSILGCSPEELSEVLRTLGFSNEMRPKKVAISQPMVVQQAPEAVPPDLEFAVATDQPPIIMEPELPFPPIIEAAVIVEASNVDAVGEPAEPVAEPELQEVWRPRRRGNRPERSKRARASGSSPDSSASDGSRRERGGWRSRLDQPRNETKPAPGDAAPVSVDGTVATGASVPDALPVRGYRARTDDAAENGGRKRDDPDNSRRQPKRTGFRSDPSRSSSRANDERARGDKFGGPKGRSDQGRHGERRTPLNVTSSAPSPKTGGIDPDSPFAKLMALREALAKPVQDPVKP